jgi:hypothetical protein
MNFERFAAEARALAAGRYFGVQVLYYEHASGEHSLDFSVYVSGVGQFDAPEPEMAIEKVRKAMNPQPAGPADLKTVGTMEVTP